SWLGAQLAFDPPVDQIGYIRDGKPDSRPPDCARADPARRYTRKDRRRDDFDLDGWAPVSADEERPGNSSRTCQFWWRFAFGGGGSPGNRYSGGMRSVK